MNKLNELAKEIYQINVKKGFWDNKTEIGTRLMLIVSELSEALEAIRIGKYSYIDDIEKCSNLLDEEQYASFAIEFRQNIKDSFEDEIADTFIRLLDLVGKFNIDIECHIYLKMNYNKSRLLKHGKLF